MEFLSNTNNIRNICILAHVDHGKTTIADSLIASNGIISHRMSGKMRYLDNRQDEQERGITMKSSSIALKYTKDSGERYLINLVDTPGHVDFCGEVSAAVRLCDGALIVVDVVEGVCPQTKTALEQAWKEGIEPILVFNKIDRLILEQQLDETAAYIRLNQLLEQINAIVATLLATEVFEDEATANSVKNINLSRQRTKSSDSYQQNSDSIDASTGIQVYDWASAIEDIDDDKYYFMPEKNNVIFASSIDDWAFTIGSFADILSSRYKINQTALRKTLWGDFYIDVKQKRILKNAQSKVKKNLFISMVLENIWKIYDTICVRRDKIKMEKMCQVLGIQLSQRDMNHTDARYQIKLTMSKWLQLSKNVLESVTNIVPSPQSLSEKRIERLLSTNMRRFEQQPKETQELKNSFLRCSADSETVKVACISKLFPYEKKNLPEFRKNVIRRQIGPPPARSDPSQVESREINKKTILSEPKPITEKEESAANETLFIAFARVFSGKLRKGDKVYVLGPRHDPSLIDADAIKNIDETKLLEDLEVNEHVTIATIENLYLLMGREIERIDDAPAGNIVGIQGLDKHLVRTATISNVIHCPPFNDLHLPATPILRVAIEPTNPLEMSTLVSGLKLLNQADPCVEVKLQETGEHVIIATGEVHLEHCIKDLRERYANNIELNVSPPIVAFRETIVKPPKTDMVNETIDDNNMLASARNQTSNSKTKGIVELLTPNRKCKIKMRASPISEQVLSCLTNHTEELRLLGRLITSKNRTITEMEPINQKKINDFKDELKIKLDLDRRKDRSEPRRTPGSQDDIVERIWSFGPKYSGPNILIASPDCSVQYSLWSVISEMGEIMVKSELSDYIDSFISGFQLATNSGPLCEEPMMGVCFTILEWSYTESNNSAEQTNSASTFKDSYGPMSGQIISTVKECCRKSFQAQPQRLMSPMFSCDIQVTAEVLGKMYAVIGRRQGKILDGDMREGSQTFEIKALIPVIESLDFVSEIRKQTSGMANPQLIFSHYEIIDKDPYWTPSTEEEYALLGEKADTENIALKYMNLVRRRKGLSVQEKIVEHAEKQRTIKRNK